MDALLRDTDQTTDISAISRQTDLAQRYESRLGPKCFIGRFIQRPVRSTEARLPKICYINLG